MDTYQKELLHLYDVLHKGEPILPDKYTYPTIRNMANKLRFHRREVSAIEIMIDDIYQAEFKNIDMKNL